MVFLSGRGQVAESTRSEPALTAALLQSGFCHSRQMNRRLSVHMIFTPSETLRSCGRSHLSPVWFAHSLRNRVPPPCYSCYPHLIPSQRLPGGSNISPKQIPARIQSPSIMMGNELDCCERCQKRGGWGDANWLCGCRLSESELAL